jgi:TPR repeat protein
MRRQDIQLLAAARAGDVRARCEVGRRYLLGEQGFAHHLPTGIEYLTHASVRDSACAQRTLAEALPVHELLAAHLLETAERAAQDGSSLAQLKAAAGHLTNPLSWARSAMWLHRACEQGHPAAQSAWAAARAHAESAKAAAAVLRELARAGVVNAVALLRPALAKATADADLEALWWCLRLAEPWLTAQARELAAFVVEAIDLAERQAHRVCGLSAAQVQGALEYRLAQGDLRAAYILGRALAGLPCANLNAHDLVTSGSLRKAAALLLRAADGGVHDAWMHLYRLSSDHRCTVANPQMARFFLEKSAASGSAEAQRRLGTLLLRQSEDAAQSERALHWLHRAQSAGDPVARALMESLVLPVSGSDDEAESALRVVQRADPWLAARLAVARQFGLTRLEALALNPARSLRAWGLVAGPHPRVLKAGLAAARAVPARSQAAMNCLHAAASLFNRPEAVARTGVGDIRHQNRTVRTLFSRHGISETLFFARATSRTLEGLRHGPRWAAAAIGLVKEALLEAA